MRIALFSECYLPRTNGAVTSITALRETLRAWGHTVYLFAPGEKLPEDDPEIFRLPELPFPRFPYPYARPFPSTPVDFADLKVDLIHSQHPFTVGRLGAGLAKRYRLPLIYTVHAQYDLLAMQAAIRPLRPVGSFAARTILKRYCRRADCTIAPSAATATALHTMGVTNRIEVVPSGIRPLTFSSEGRHRIRVRLDFSEATPVLLYVGRLCRVKHLEILFHAVALLQTRNLSETARNFRLVLVGEGSCRRELEALATALGIQARVHFVGLQPHAEIRAWYSAGDIFTLPSPSETQGLVLAEAMMVGLPCIAIQQGGPCDMVIDQVTGFLVSPEAQAFANAIEPLLCSPQLRKQLGANGQRHARAFSVQTMAGRILQIYNEHLSPGQRI